MRFQSIFVVLILVALTACSDREKQANLVSGISLDHMDASVRPQEDFGRYANGKWYDSVEMPADKTRVGVFTELSDQSEANVREIIDALVGNPSLENGNDAQRVADFFRSYTDMESRNKLGIDPIGSESNRFDPIPIGFDRLFWIQRPYRVYIANSGECSYRC
jgi:putative endopeptidase